MLVAIRPGGRGDITESHLAWQLNRSVPEIPSPLFHDDLIYMVRNGGILTAVDSATGDIRYRERLEGSGHYSASPVLADGHLYLFSNRGQVSVVKAGSELEITNQEDLEEPVFVTPAFDERTIYIRTETHLMAFRNPE
jgi:outer membrane protein assembly factor BamB